MKNIINSAYYSKEIKKKSGHHHDCHQLILVVSGSMKIDVGGKACVVNEGELVIVSRYESHSVTVLSDVYERYVVRINPYFESDNMAYSLFINRPVGFSNVINVRDRFEEIASIFSSIVRKKASGEAMSEDMNQLLLNQLLINLYRISPDSFANLGEERFDVVYCIQRLFENDCKQQYSLSSLAKKYHISSSTLSHQFKKITGVSVFEYLVSCRLALAKAQLAKTKMRINEIVEECGFCDNSNFSRTFKKSVGMTPSQFRRAYQREGL